MPFEHPGTISLIGPLWNGSTIAMRIRIQKVVPYLLIFLCALAIGGVVQWANGPRSVEELAAEELDGDQADYHRLAQRFMETGKFGEPGQLAYRAPLYPILLGLVYRWCGPHIQVARGLNTLLAALLAVSASLIAVKVSGSQKAAVPAASLVCLNSYWWLQQTVLMPENLAALLLGLSLWCWPEFSSHSRAVSRRLQKHGGWVAASGVLFGLSQLTKPLLLPALMLLPLLAALISRPSQRQTQVAFSLLFVLTSLLPLGIWSHRNFRSIGEWVPITTGSGEVFWGAHAPQTIATAKGMWTNQPLPPHWAQQIEEAPPRSQEVLSSRVRWQAGRESLGQAAWADVLLHFAYKPARLWSPSTYFPGEGRWLWLKVVLVAWNSLILVGFIYQCHRARTQQPLVLALVAGLTLTCLIFWGTIRFQYVLLPVIAAWAALNIYRYFPDLPRFKGHRRSGRSAWAHFPWSNQGMRNVKFD